MNKRHKQNRNKIPTLLKTSKEIVGSKAQSINLKVIYLYRMTYFYLLYEKLER